MTLAERIDFVVVAAPPPSMLGQWADELETRFGLRFTILDRAFLAAMRRERGFAVNPWLTASRFLVSQRLLVDPTYTEGLVDALRDFRPGSLLILDEAHHAAPASGRKYAIDSHITEAIRELAPKFERLYAEGQAMSSILSGANSPLLTADDMGRLTGKLAGRKMVDQVSYLEDSDVIAVQSGHFAVLIDRNFIGELRGLSPTALRDLKSSAAGATIELEDPDIHIEAAGLLAAYLNHLRATRAGARCSNCSKVASPLADERDVTNRVSISDLPPFRTRAMIRIA